MAHYAKISNEEFTVAERARLEEVRTEIDAIQRANRESQEYISLKELYGSKNTSETLESLKADLNNLYADLENPPAEEDVTTIQTAISQEKDSLAAERESILADMETLENQGTETLVAEQESLNTAISNALCRVTKVLTGVDEIKMIPGDSSALQAEAEALEESKRDITYNPLEEEEPAELKAINQQIQAKIEEIRAIPQVEFDNSVYWEGFYGGCKRTSYNTQGGVHKHGGTPFRKNYAGVGDIYDPVRDAFYAEQPYPSWTLNEDTCYWEPPVPKPEGAEWQWNEATLEWFILPEYPNDGSAYKWNDNTLQWDFIESYQPYPSWIWSTELKVWEAPTPKPMDGDFIWNEQTLNWEEI